MSNEPEASLRTRLLWRILACVLALYVIAYFPALSYIVRHPQYQRAAAVRIPSVVRHLMFRPWAKLDPAGFQIVDSQLAAHPSP